MTKFHQSALCESRSVCVRCRDTGKSGDRFRADAAKRYQPPHDWDCPHGLPWGVTRDKADPYRRAAKLVQSVDRKTGGNCRERKLARERARA